MLTPLTQRQVLQTATAETMRVAMEGAASAQRDSAMRQTASDRQVLEREQVPTIENVETLKVTERQGRGRQKGGSQQQESDSEEPPKKTSANNSEGHFDILA